MKLMYYWMIGLIYLVNEIFFFHLVDSRHCFSYKELTRLIYYCFLDFFLKNMLCGFFILG